MIRTKSIFKNLPKAAPEVEPIQNPDLSAVCPICLTEIGQTMACYRLSSPAVLAHYGCETAWVRAETAILVVCKSAPKSRKDLAVAVHNGRIFGRVLESLVETGQIERSNGRLEERFILDTRADAEKVIEFLAAAGPQNGDTIMVACRMAGARCTDVLHGLVASARISEDRQGLLVWYTLQAEIEAAA